MSALSSLKSDASIANEKDSVGGTTPLESGLYPSSVSMAYLNKASSGALGLVISLKTAENKEVRQTFWMTAGQAKGGNNYYTDKNGDRQYLPGFIQANSLCLLTTGKEVSDMDTETKVIKLYSPEAKAEVPTKVEVLTDLLNKDVIVGLIKQIVDKTKKNEATGTYEATGETKEENEVDKFFRASDRMTTAEIRAQAEEASFINTWESKWTGKTKEKAKSASGTAGAPKLSGLMAAGKTAKKPTTSLFG